MLTGNVGAGILNVITESLYDKPIVVFREYVQNSIDSFFKKDKEQITNQLKSQIWLDNEDLYFLDNGKGIEADKFNMKMINIGKSGKIKTENIGYKGIGRLSGISYCDKLVFINIISLKNNDYQKFTIDCKMYRNIKNTEEYYQMDWGELINRIGKFEDEISSEEIINVRNRIERYSDMFAYTDSGFLVTLFGINEILKQTIQEQDFLENLGWLLPVDFKKELYKIKQHLLFEDMSSPNDKGIVPAKGYLIYFNEILIERPITPEELRFYVCKLNLRYAVGFHTFQHDKIAVIKGNSFSGIRIYIDNMLLCDESELLPILQQYCLIRHTVNELVQTVKGIGAMIYITDKVSISANARRTFIEVVDADSLEFLRLIAEFIESIYEARYALSKYSSGLKKVEITKERIDELKQNALISLKKLAREEVVIEEREGGDKKDFDQLSEIEQKQAVKQKINKVLNDKVKTYLTQTTSYDYENAFNDFKIWLSMN